MLTQKYLKSIPADSRAASPNSPFLQEAGVREHLSKIRALNTIAEARGQSLAQMAICWVLRRKTVTSALIGASRREQILDILAGLAAAPFSEDELQSIDAACALS
jgi:L-glyceraldehyde 3-phosphate reductase